MATETIRYSPLGRQDLRIGIGKFEVTLADGRVVLLDEVDIGYLMAELFTRAGLPAPGTTGRLTRVSDDRRGLFRDFGDQWQPNSLVVNPFDFPGTDIGARINAAALALPNGGCIGVPEGLHTYTTPIVLRRGICLAGTISGEPGGVVGSQLLFTGLGVAVSADFSAANGTCLVRDLYIKGTSSASGLIFFNRVIQPGAGLLNVRAETCSGPVIDLDECIDLLVFNVYATGGLSTNGHGFRVRKSNFLHFLHCTAETNQRDGFRLEGAEVSGAAASDNAALTLMHCRAEANDRYGMFLGVRRNFLIQACWLENNAHHGIVLLGDERGDTGNRTEMGRIIGNHVLTGAKTGTGLGATETSGIFLRQADEIEVMGNYIDGFQAAGLGANIIVHATGARRIQWSHNFSSSGLITPNDETFTVLGNAGVSATANSGLKRAADMIYAFSAFGPGTLVADDTIHEVPLVQNIRIERVTVWVNTAGTGTYNSSNFWRVRVTDGTQNIDVDITATTANVRYTTTPASPPTFISADALTVKILEVGTTADAPGDINVTIWYRMPE